MMMTMRMTRVMMMMVLFAWLLPFSQQIRGLCHNHDEQNDEHNDEHDDDDDDVVVVEDVDDVVVVEDEHDVDDDFCVNDKRNYYYLVVSQKGFIQRINCNFRIYCIVISYFEQTALTELWEHKREEALEYLF